MSTPEETRPKNFLETLIAEHLRDGVHTGVVTRFPPEPNGYLHIGHAKSICLNFGLAQQFGGRCNLRMDDTNPVAEDVEYVESIANDVRWLGFEVGEVLFASDYFEQMYRWAEDLILAGKAYVDEQDLEAIRAGRGSLTEPGTASPYRDRPVAESLDLFRRMRAGEFPDGAMVLRAKIDMANPNMIMRDPLLYRIRHAHHHRTGDAWCIYPMYDYAHCLEDAIEGITHSICTLEFENNREIYDWLIDTLDVPAKPRQYEFARLALDYTLMSKRKLLKLVQTGTVRGWDDPRMPTVAGLRRRGYTPSAIRSFCDLIGVSKANSRVDFGKLEYAIRNDLNPEVPRVMGIARPLELVITNWPGGVEWLDAALYPHDVPKEGSRQVPFSGRLYIEQDDFAEEPPAGWHRLAPGREVRLRYGYYVTCTGVEHGPDGALARVLCTYDPATAGGASPDGRKVKGTLHWLSAEQAVPAELRLYDHLFASDTPDREDWEALLNPNSLEVLQGFVEPSLAGDPAGSRYQFERLGYFISDAVDSKPGGLVFNRIVTLRDSWAKQTKKDEPAAVAPPPVVEKKPDTRPTKLGKSEIRARIRAEDAGLAARYASFQAELGLSEEDADVLTGDGDLAAFFEATLAAGADVAAATRWVINEVLREVKDRPIAELRLTPAALAGLIGLVDAGRLSVTAGKEVFAALVSDGGDPAAIMAARGLEQLSDTSALAAAVDAVIAASAGQVERYRAGNTGLLGFFIGQVMKATGGRADPAATRALLTERLDR
ncbi:MAG: glutamine--tRNA ligase/YqeY domain fusion protein [bacterium]